MYGALCAVCSYENRITDHFSCWTWDRCDPGTFDPLSLPVYKHILFKHSHCNFSIQQVCWCGKPMKYHLETMTVIPEFFWSSNLLVCQCHWQLIKYWLKGQKWTFSFSLCKREIGLKSLGGRSFSLQWDGDSQKICQDCPWMSLKAVGIIWSLATSQYGASSDTPSERARTTTVPGHGTPSERGRKTTMPGS